MHVCTSIQTHPSAEAVLRREAIRRGKPALMRLDGDRKRKKGLRACEDVFGNSDLVPLSVPTPLESGRRLRRRRRGVRRGDGSGDEGHLSLSRAGGDAIRWTVRETVVDVVAVERREVWREITSRVWMKEKDAPNIRAWG